MVAVPAFSAVTVVVLPRSGLTEATLGLLEVQVTVSRLLLYTVTFAVSVALADASRLMLLLLRDSATWEMML